MNIRLFIKVGLVLTAIVVSLQAVPGDALVWRIEGLVAAKPVTGSQNLSLAVNMAGKPHLGYLGNKYAVFDGSSWHFEKVVGELPYSGTADYGCLAFGPNADLHIVYRLKDTDNMIYAHYNGSQWSFIDVDLDGYPVALAVDSFNCPHVAVNYYGSAKYTWFDGATWHSEVIQSYSYPNNWNMLDIKLDSSGHPHVLASGTQLLYARHDGTAWIREYIPDINSAAAGLALNSSNEPQIVAYIYNTGIKHIYKVGGVWQSNLFDGTGQPKNISVKSDSNNRIHVSYNKSSLIRYGVYDGSWQVETVDDIAYANEAVALDLDSKGRAHISYLENASSGLKYAMSVSTLYPEASFVASPVDGPSPLTVQFSNSTTGTVSSWLWDFGDGTTSTEHSPVHTYTQIGHYTVTLSSGGEYGSDSFSLPNAVWVYRLPQGENYMITVGEIDEETSPAENRITIIKKGEDTISGYIWLGNIPRPRPFGISSTGMGEDTYVSLFDVGEVHKYPQLYQVPKVYPSTFINFMGIGSPYGNTTSADNQYCYVAGSHYPGSIYRLDNNVNSISEIVLSDNMWKFEGMGALALSTDGSKLFAAAGSYHHGAAAGVCNYIAFIRNPNTEDFDVEPVEIIKCASALGAIAIAPNNRDVFVGSYSSLDNKAYVIKAPIEPLNRYIFATSAYNGQTAYDLEVASLRAKNIIAIPIQGEPHEIAVSPDGRWVYATMRSGNVAIIDTSTNTVVKNVSVGSELRGIDFSPDGAFVYVGAYRKLAVIDVATKSVIKNIPIEHWAFAVDVTLIPSACAGDLDEDGDVDGNDLKMFIESGNLTVGLFAQGFGRSNCP